MDMSVEKLMSDKIFSIEATKNVRQAANEMADKGTGSLLITQGGGYVGIITEVDIVRKIVAKGINPETVTVTETMSSPVLSVDVSQSLIEANDLMEQNKIRHVGVTRQGSIVGMLSVRDLLHPVYVG